MQPTSEKCSYLEQLSCKEDSLKENRFRFNQNQDTLHSVVLVDKPAVEEFLLLTLFWSAIHSCM